jgi:hypothetical protein
VPGAGMKSDQTAGNSNRDPVQQKIVHIQPIFFKTPQNNSKTFNQFFLSKLLLSNY